jgi:triosephosphate isomerase (TIM)
LPMIAGNWKMNTTLGEAVALVKTMLPELEKIDGVEKVVCPPFISLAAVKELLKNSQVKLGAQNVYFAEKGAYTGEVSPLMLKDLCHYVIIGHSERRQYFNETNELVNKKLAAAIKAGLAPILCVGERLEENEAGNTEEVVGKQVREGLSGIAQLETLVIAYEPIWAIGTGRAATGKQADDTIGFIRHNVAQINNNIADNIRILYGGSVTAENIAEFIKQPQVDGALVGGASLKADQFVSIVKQTSEIKARTK